MFGGNESVIKAIAVFLLSVKIEKKENTKINRKFIAIVVIIIICVLVLYSIYYWISYYSDFLLYIVVTIQMKNILLKY